MIPTPEKCISISDAEDLQQEWWNTRLEVTTNGKKHKDTCEFHFTLNELQEYLDYVREKSAEMKIENPGINIWLGAYKARNNKPNLSTVFLSATREKSENNTEEDGRDYEKANEIEPFNQAGGLWAPGQY